MRTSKGIVARDHRALAETPPNPQIVAGGSEAIGRGLEQAASSGLDS